MEIAADLFAGRLPALPYFDLWAQPVWLITITLAWCQARAGRRPRPGGRYG